MEYNFVNVSQSDSECVGKIEYTQWGEIEARGGWKSGVEFWMKT